MIKSADKVTSEQLKPPVSQLDYVYYIIDGVLQKVQLKDIVFLWSPATLKYYFTCPVEACAKTLILTGGRVDYLTRHLDQCHAGSGLYEFDPDWTGESQPESDDD